MNCILVKVKLEDKEKIIELIQLFLSFKSLESEHIDMKRFLRGNFSKLEFVRFAKDQLEMFGTRHSGIGENGEDYEIYKERACALYNNWFLN